MGNPAVRKANPLSQLKKREQEKDAESYEGLDDDKKNETKKNTK